MQRCKAGEQEEVRRELRGSLYSTAFLPLRELASITRPDDNCRIRGMQLDIDLHQDLPKVRPRNH